MDQFNSGDFWRDLKKQCVHILETSPHEMAQDIAKKIHKLPNFIPNLKVSDNQLPFEQAFTAINDKILSTLLMKSQYFIPWELRAPGHWDVYGPQAEAEIANQGWIDLIGPGSLQHATDFRMGFYWQAEETVYPAHRHNAEEFYYILSGSAIWMNNAGKQIRNPNDSFVHQSLEDHATTTTKQPVFALWAWRGDIDFGSYSKDAS